MENLDYELSIFIFDRTLVTAISQHCHSNPTSLRLLWIRRTMDCGITPSWRSCKNNL